MLTSAKHSPYLLILLIPLILLLVLIDLAPAGAGEHGRGYGGHRGGGRNIGPGIVGGIGAAIIIHEALKERNRHRDEPPPRERHRPEKVKKKKGCPDGWNYSRRRGRCTPPKQEAKIDCDFPYVRSGKRCVCAAGYVTGRRGKCIKPKVEVDVAEPRRDPPRKEKDRGIKRVEPKAQPEAPQLVVATPVPVREKGARCLPQDLFDRLAEAYGSAPAGLSACPTACLPKPGRFSDAELEKAVADAGVDWCDSCIELNAWLPLSTIAELEEATGKTFCAASPDACVYRGSRDFLRKKEIRELFSTLPATIGKEGAIAIVIGNEVYAGETPVNVNAHRDAEAVEMLLTEQLGFARENIVMLKDAKLSDLESLLGPESADGGELLRKIGGRADADILIYVSSHGLIDADGRAYLAPVDLDTGRLADTGYPMSRLYANLGKTGARTIMLALEATFASDLNMLADPPNLPGIEVAVMPETPVPGLAIFKASDRDQRTLEDPEFGIGLFTRHFIEGLAGKADGPPIGNGDRRIDTVELFVFTADVVRMAARKSFGLEQKPILEESGNLVVGRLAAR